MSSRVGSILGILVVVLGLGVIVAYYGFGQSSAERNNRTIVEYVSPTGEVRRVTYIGDSVAQMQSEDENIPFAITVSASGARYENVDRQLILWNKGTELVLYQGEEILFKGRDVTRVEQLDTEILTTWVLQSVEKDNEGVKFKNSNKFSLTFANGQVSGTTDCNTLSGTYTFRHGVVTFGPLVMTKKFCTGSEEKKFTELLSVPYTVAIVTEPFSMLTLSNDTTSIVLEKQ